MFNSYIYNLIVHLTMMYLDGYFPLNYTNEGPIKSVVK